MSRAQTLHPAAVARLHRVRLAGVPGEGDPRHGTHTGYAAGCKDECCRAAHAQHRRRLYKRPRPLIDVTGTRRRIQALACLGWSTAELSRRLGKHRSYLLKVMDGGRTTVQVETALIVAALYEQLSMTRCPSERAPRTASEARQRGWVPPLGWDRIDDPQERPRSGTRLPDVDPDVLSWITVEGQWQLARGADAPLRDAVRSWWATTGRPWAELERLTGWNVARDQRRSGQITAAAS